MRAVELETNIKVRQNILDDGIMWLLFVKKSLKQNPQKSFFVFHTSQNPKTFSSLWVKMEKSTKFCISEAETRNMWCGFHNLYVEKPE